MLPEFFDEFKKWYEQNLVSLLTISVKMQKMDTFTQAEELQQNIILFGNHLEEKYHMEDSDAIHKLEECCETIYRLSAGEITAPECGTLLRAQLKEFGKMMVAARERLERHTSIVLIAKNEDRDICEWLDYHRMIGIEHFYIYDNGSEPSFRFLLEPYICNGLVTYHWFPGEVKQLEAYNHALKNYEMDTRYMAFIDADEFLVSVEGRPICQVIDEIIDGYNRRKKRLSGQAGGIGVNWRSYGSSGYVEPAEGSVIETHTLRARDMEEDNIHIKTICNPRVVRCFPSTPHDCEYEKGYYTISENGSCIPGPFFFDSQCRRLRINHYYMKSEKEYFEKVRRGWPIWKHKEIPDEDIQLMFRDLCDAYNAVSDDILVPYGKKMREMPSAGLKYAMYCRKDYETFCAQIAQKKAKRVLDVGMLLKRFGLLSRQYEANAIEDDVVLVGIFFPDDTPVPAYRVIYNKQYSLEEWLSEREREKEHYDLMNLIHAKPFVSPRIWNRLLEFGKSKCDYILLDEWESGGTNGSAALGEIGGNTSPERIYKVYSRREEIFGERRNA
ncbi:MAG: glycosyltransferase family 2 protein [Lachnospiraceae bacterium]